MSPSLIGDVLGAVGIASILLLGAILFYRPKSRKF